MREAVTCYCPECGKGFISAWDFGYHMNKEHGDNIDLDDLIGAYR